MPLRPGTLLAALIVTLATGTARAARLPFAAELSIELLAPGHPPLVLTGTGVATVNGSGGGAHLASAFLDGGVTGTTTVPVTDPEVTMNGGFAALRAPVALGSGTLGFGRSAYGAPLLTQNALPVGGIFRLCLIDSSCTTGIRFLLSASGGARGLGVGGVLTTGTPSRRFTLSVAPWTVGTTFVTLTTSSGSSFALPVAGWVHGPSSFSTSTALSGGALSLVTPILIRSNHGMRLPGFGRLELRFLPEPGWLVAWGAGVAALLAQARARRRRRA